VRRRYLLESSGGLPVAPLVDVVLLLLIFFMLITRYMPPSLSVNLPEASAAQPDDHPSVVLSIDAEGQLAVDGEDFAWEALPRLLADRDPETRVRIAADKAVDYDYIIRAMNAAAEAGLPRIVLETLPGARP
jgi:biopolymer transport protein ExbD